MCAQLHRQSAEIDFQKQLSINVYDATCKVVAGHRLFYRGSIVVYRQALPFHCILWNQTYFSAMDFACVCVSSKLYETTFS
jgi:hypothetical protein